MNNIREYYQPLYNAVEEYEQKLMQENEVLANEILEEYGIDAKINLSVEDKRLAKR